MKIFSFLPVFLLLGCEKASPDNQTDFNALLTQGLWTTTLSYIDDDGDGILDLQSDSCNFDNTWDFKTDGTLTYADGPTSCDEDNPPFSIPATWVLQNNDTKLILGIGIDEQHYLIQSITATEMVLFTLKTGTDIQNGEKVILRR